MNGVATVLSALVAAVDLALSLAALMVLALATVETRSTECLAKWKRTAVVWTCCDLAVGLLLIEARPVASALLLTSSAVCGVIAALGFVTTRDDWRRVFEAKEGAA